MSKHFTFGQNNFQNEAQTSISENLLWLQKKIVKKYENEISPAQDWLLQDLDLSLEPEQVPPLVSHTVLERVDAWVPPSQLLEHDPHADHFDHWQLIGAEK